MAKRKKKRGRYCKGCGENRPNEKFNAKGRRLNLCKDCQKNGVIDEEDFFDCDETFAFIADYTDSGVPFGVTHEGWAEIEEAENGKANEIRLTLPREVEEPLYAIFLNQSTEQMLSAALAMTLFVTHKISMAQAAFLTNVSFTDYIELLQSNQVSWQNHLDDGYTAYKKSLPNLLDFVDRIVEAAEE